MITSVTTGLRDSQLAHFEKNGFIILRDVFSAGECDAYRERMNRLATSKETLEGFRIQEHYSRSFNQHLYDPSCETWMIDARLQRPLEDIVGGKVEAIQTMHFFIGSEHRRHQDQYYLSDCLATWIPFEDVSEENGTIFVEPGSHRRRFIAKHDVPKLDEMDYATHQHDVYFPKVEKVSRDSGVKPVLVEIEKGDVCIFHGRIIHGGVTPTVEGSSRKSLPATISRTSRITGIGLGQGYLSMGPGASDTPTQTASLSRIKLFHHLDEMSLVSLAIVFFNKVSFSWAQKRPLRKRPCGLGKIEIGLSAQNRANPLQNYGRGPTPTSPGVG